MLKKVVCINDLSGFGKCSLTASLPIMSALKVQCCPFPTAILSNQTGYDKYTYLDLTNGMKNYYQTWKDLNLDFDAIYTSFLVSKQQVDIVYDFVSENKNKLVVVDPIMGDNGKLFSIFDDETRNSIKKLVSLSNITTPNLTEACFLSSRDYENINSYSEDDILSIAKDISNLGPDKVIITGILDGDNIKNLCYDKCCDKHFVTTSLYNKVSYSGTGDIFTSIICAMLVNNHPLDEAISFATNFIYKCIKYTSEFDLNRNEGILFEPFIKDLTNI